jgi:hypothetical protein
LALTILGFSGVLTYDSSAVLYVNGKLVAAAEEECFVRDEYAQCRSLDAIFSGNRYPFRYRKRIDWCLVQPPGFNLKKIELHTDC